MTTADSLLLFDVDETLVHARERPLADRRADFRYGADHVYVRPHLKQLLERSAKLFQLGLWSASGIQFVDCVRWRIFPPGVTPVLTWGLEHCTVQVDHERQQKVFIKDLKKVKKRCGLARTLLVENTPANARRNYGNAIYVETWRADADDDELLKLAAYLEKLHAEPDFRRVEKRGWRSRAGGKGGAS